MEAFVEAHGAQLEAIQFPKQLIPRLYEKLAGEVFDAGAHLGVSEDPHTRERRVVCVSEAGLEPEQDVFLVDHAWTFSPESYREQLRDIPGLLERMAAMMGCVEAEDPSEADADSDVEDVNGADGSGCGVLDEASLPRRRPSWRKPLYQQVCEAAWQFAGLYRLVDPRDGFNFKTAWFVMDELGSAFTHSPRPSFRVLPLVCLAAQGSLTQAAAYSLAWPVARIQDGDVCTRDFLGGLPSAGNDRPARLATWFKLPRHTLARFQEAHERWAERNGHVAAVSEPSPKHITDASPAKAPAFFHLEPGRRLRLYCDNPQITDNLRRPEFEHVASPRDADIVWVYHTTVDRGFRERVCVREDAVVGQTVGDECLVFKHLLPLTAAKGGASKWLPRAFNLQGDTEALVWDCHTRRKAQQAWLMILKPWNMGRSMDSLVADTLAQVLRHVDTGPKVCCDYVARPALFRGRKFDLRW